MAVAKIEQVTGSTVFVGEGAWTAGSVLTNPVDTTVLVDTGALPAGRYLFAIHGTSSVAAVFDVQHRNAANGANNAAQRRRPIAGDIDFIIPNEITLADQERLRVVLVGGITGEIQLSIFVKPVYPGRVNL